MSESGIKPVARVKYDAVRAVAPDGGPMSKGAVDKSCRSRFHELSPKKDGLPSGRRVKTVRAPAPWGPSPSYRENFRHSIKPLVWGRAYESGLDLSSRPVAMGYGFALLGKGQGVVFDSPVPGDLAFILHDSNSGIFAASRLPELKDREETCAAIQKFCKTTHLGTWRTTRVPAGIVQFFGDIIKGKLFDPYFFEMLRVAREFDNLGIEAGNLDGALVYFSKSSSRKPRLDQCAKALVGAAAAAGISFAKKIAVPWAGNSAMLAFNPPVSQALMLGKTPILALGMSTAAFR